MWLSIVAEMVSGEIKLGQFIQELDSILRKIKDRKPAGLDEISLDVWKAR